MIDYGSFIRPTAPGSPFPGYSYWFDARTAPGILSGWTGSQWVSMAGSGAGAAGPSNTDSLAEGSVNLYFTGERAQDAVQSMFVVNTADIAFTYDDANNLLSTLVKSSAITFNKIRNAAKASVLLGAGSTGSGAPYAEISLGSNLSMSGTTLFASSGGGSVVNTGFNLTVREEDGSPTVTSVTVIRFPNTSMTINGSGDVSIASVNSVTVVDAISATIDGGGSAITTGVKLDLEIPFACNITRATLLADTSGSCVLDIYKDSYANYPPTSGDTITASAKPTISGGMKSQDSSLAGWTTSIAAGDTLRYYVASAATITRATLSLKVTRT